MSGIAEKVVRVFSAATIGFFRLPIVRSLCSDAFFVKAQYRYHIGRKLNLNNPKSFTEKLQWEKIFCHNPLYTKMVDKYSVRSIISDKIGDSYLVPLIVDKELKTVDEIVFEDLPNSFVLKTTHDSGSAIVVRDKNKVNYGEIKRRLKKHMRRNYYWMAREWPYKDVVPGIIIEQYVHDNDSEQYKDYKIFCFNGIPKFIQVISHIDNNEIINTYSPDWKYVDISFGHNNDPSLIDGRPKNLEKMLELSRVLSVGFPFIRIDLHDTGSCVYFGEFTFYDYAGYVKLESEEYDIKLGEMMDLSLLKQEH